MAASTDKPGLPPGEREFDPSRWAHVAYFAFFLMLAWCLVHLTEDAWDIMWSIWPQMGRPQRVPSMSIDALGGSPRRHPVTRVL